MKEEAAEQSQTTASATSSGWPMRPTGWSEASSSRAGAFGAADSISAVSTKAGQTALTRIPRLAYSSEAAFVSPTIAC
jgi:hypothetical protein